MKTLIVGGGLSGLALADRLEGAGQDYLLLEARDRFGGRVLTERLSEGEAFDMGPAWFWPGQPRIAALISRLGLTPFDQFAAGDLIYEDEGGQVHRGAGYASMEGSWRLVGGMGALTQALSDRIPPSRKRLNAPVARIERSGAGIAVTLTDGTTAQADRAVLAMPPRLMAGLDYAPALPPQALQAMAAVPTWMAGQAKAIAVYDAPFWRHAGLSGDAMSRRGPMVEIHDASPAEGGPFALFGFIGVPPRARTDTQALRQAVVAQLRRLFGEKAATPRGIFLKDWASDPLTATPADMAPLYDHPAYGLPQALQGLWSGTLVLAGTEVASDFGGYLEGALEAAEAAQERLTGTSAPPSAQHPTTGTGG